MASQIPTAEKSNFQQNDSQIMRNERVVSQNLLTQHFRQVKFAAKASQKNNATISSGPLAVSTPKSNETSGNERTDFGNYMPKVPLKPQKKLMALKKLPPAFCAANTSLSVASKKIASKWSEPTDQHDQPSKKTKLQKPSQVLSNEKPDQIIFDTNKNEDQTNKTETNSPLIVNLSIPAEELIVTTFEALNQSSVQNAALNTDNKKSTGTSETSKLHTDSFTNTSQRESILTEDSGCFELSQSQLSVGSDFYATQNSRSIEFALAETAENLSQELIAELDEALNLAPENDYVPFNEQTTEAVDNSLINRMLNAPIPDEKNFLLDLHRVKRPHNTNQRDFFLQKKRTNEVLQTVFETLNTVPADTELAQDPEGLTVPLMQHQRHALKWMEFIERRHPYGGLLADDMGLGKTLTVLALVMTEKNRLQNETAEEWNSEAYQANTLVVCPPSLLHQWEMEVNTKFAFAMLPLVFYGSVDRVDIKNMKNFDVVITTYDTLLNDRLAKHIYSKHWRRVILDEAHIIRNPSTQKSEAVCGISAKHCWALTGTPIHNKETDVFALLKFLKYSPFDQRSFWNLWLSGHTRLGVLLRSIMLRRTKEALKKQNIMFDLPPQTIEIRIIALSDEEMEVHQAILSFSRPLVQRYIQQYQARKDPTNSDILVSNLRGPTERDQREFLRKLQCDEANIGQHVIYVLLLRLTQVCCHPGLAESMLYDNDIDDNGDNQAEGKIKIKTEKYIKTEPHNRQVHKATVRQILNRNNPLFDLRYPSSKMLQVLQILQERVLISQDKAVIVSQYTAYLAVIELFLASKGIGVLNFNGKMNLDERQKSLDQFNFSDGEGASKVLLLSLKCGGVGLNLTAANHLILMDLPWNPQLEAQAQDRIYRLGQTKPVFVYKFLCTNTVEEHIKSRQDDKLKLASSVLTGAESLQNSGCRFSIPELKRLFGISDD